MTPAHPTAAPTENKTPEEWLGFVVHRGYDVSSWGRFRSYHRKGYRYLFDEPAPIRSKQCDRYGHRHIRLYSNGRKYTLPVGRIVLEAFVGPCPVGMQCRHLNGCASDNHVENLCWGTAKENCLDTVAHGHHVAVPHPGETNPHARLTWLEVTEIRSLAQSGMRTGQIAARFHLNPATVYRIVRNAAWKTPQAEPRR